MLLLVASVAILCAGTVAWLGYRGARSLLMESLESQVRSLAMTAAAAVDVDLHTAVERQRSVESPEYRTIEKQLRALRDLWREAGIEVRFVYTIGPDARAPSGWGYVVDAEEPGPAKSLPGQPVTNAGPRAEGSGAPTRRAVATIISDEYGETLTGLAPLLAADGRVVGTVGVDIPVSVIRALERELLTRGTATTVIAVLLALLAGWIVVRRIVGPLERLRQFAGAIAEGDLTSGASSGGAREVVAVGESLDSLREALRSLVGRIHEATVCANDSCFMLTHRAAEEGDRARIAAANAVEATGRAGEIASTSRNLAQAATDLRTTASSVIEAGTEGLENLRGIAGTVDHLRQTGQALAEQLEAVRERARTVDSLLEAMVAVADRSNLLSLNAEIEASNAGEAGRGFMVVAGEIRRLAEQASASALQIEGNVQRMHESVDAGVEATMHLAQSLATSAERAQHGAELLTTSIDGIESLGPRIRSIADSSTRQLEGAEAISRAMGGLAESATNALDFFEAVEGMVTDLRRRGAELQQAVERFRV